MAGPDTSKGHPDSPDLQECRENLQTLADNAIDGILIVLGSEAVVYANRRSAEITGFASEELVNTELRKLVHPDQRELVMDRFRRRMSGEDEPRQYETRFLRKNGDSLPVELAATLTVWRGEIADMILFRDITKQKEAQDATRKAEGNLRERINELNCLYGISDLVERPGVSLDEILQGTVDLIPPAMQYPELTCAGIFLTDRKFNTHNFRKTAWRLEKDIKVHGQPEAHLLVCYLDEMPQSHLGPFQVEEKRLLDAIAERLGRIIERSWAREALTTSEKNFRALVENSPTAILIVRDDEVVFQNPECPQLLGVVPRSAHFVDLGHVHHDDTDRVKSFYSVLDSGNFKTLDLQFRFFPASQRRGKPQATWVQCRASLMEYLGKESVLVNIMDVTKARELERLVRIEDKMSSLGRMTAGIAHEIRNPLSGINIYINTLEKLYRNREQLDKVGQILTQLQSASGKIESVIKRVLDFSRSSEPAFKLVDVNVAVREALKLSAVTLRKGGISVEEALAEDLPQCSADTQMMEEVILNLLTNAAEAMKGMINAKRIRVSSSADKDSIELTVSDSGPGVPEMLRETIFDPFCTTKTYSTGIGLSLCHRIVRDHGGTIGVSESDWGGAQFTITLPTKRNPDKQ